MIDAQLSGLAMQGFNMAKVDLEHDRFNFLMATYFESEGLKRMAKLEATIIDKLGGNWLNSGRTKDIGFGLIKLAVSIQPPDALVFVTVCNAFKPTSAMLALPKKKRHSILDAGHDRHHEAVKEGLLTVEDALWSIAQTCDRVSSAVQPIVQGRDGVAFSGQPQISFMKQSDYDGRTKFYGCDPAEYAMFGKPGAKQCQ